MVVVVGRGGGDDHNCELTNQCICFGGTRVSGASRQTGGLVTLWTRARSTAVYLTHPSSEEFTMRLLWSTFVLCAMPCE